MSPGAAIDYNVNSLPDIIVHELPVTKNILQIAEEQAKKAGKGRITGITIAIGDLSGIEFDCVQFYFDELKKGSIAGSARLAHSKIPLKLKCRRCSREFLPESTLPPWECPGCNNDGADIIEGRDSYVESIEVE